MTAARTYVTLLSTDDYLDGVLVLDASLKSVASRSALLVLVAHGVSARSVAVLKSFNIGTKRLSEKISIPDDILRMNVDHNLGYWNNIFDKLFIFDLIEFKKLVYIDSDMLVLRNIDELFEHPHMSAIVAGRSFPDNEGWKELNAGLIVIEPQPELSKKILAVLPQVIASHELVSDQTLLHHYDLGWSTKELLHLDERYNVFATILYYYTDKLGYRLSGSKSISVVHFIGATKPWHRTWAQQWDHLRRLRYFGKYKELKVNVSYLFALMKVRLAKRIKRTRISRMEMGLTG